MNADILILHAGGDELPRITRAGYKVVREEGKKWAARGVPVKSLPSRVWDRIKDKLCGV